MRGSWIISLMSALLVENVNSVQIKSLNLVPSEKLDKYIILT